MTFHRSRNSDRLEEVESILDEVGGGGDQMNMRYLMALMLIFTHARAESLEYEAARYQLYRVPKQDYARLHLRWLDAKGQPLSNFGALQTELAAEGKSIAFATNAGIYERGPKPCGLTICGGREWVPINLRLGEGNFYLKPNGIFYLDDKSGPGIVEAGEYPALTVRPRLANQSGPLLLRRGVIHPAFRAGSPNKRQRSAVGIVKATGEIVFAMSEREDRVMGRVTFHQLARLFLHLGCEDALYLDGDISQMTVKPPVGTVFTPNTFAAMFVVTE